MNRHRVVPQEMVQTLNQLRTKALSGDQLALERLIKLLKPRVPTGQLFDRSGLHDREDIEALKAVAVWQAVQDYREDRGTTFETFAIIRMRQHVLSTVRHKSAAPPKFLYPEQEEMLDIMDREYGFTLPDTEHEILMLRRLFEKALQRKALPGVVKVYTLCRERPWLTHDDLADLLQVSTQMIRNYLACIKRLLLEVQQQILSAKRELGIHVGY